MIPTHLLGVDHNHRSITLTLIRWMSPHPDAILRDSSLRPVCPAPLDINHALWTFSQSPRPLINQRIIDTHYTQPNVDASNRHIESERLARFGLVTPESIKSYVNCTFINNERDVMIETIVLPF